MNLEDRAWRWYQEKFKDEEPSHDVDCDRIEKWAVEEGLELVQALRRGESKKRVLEELGDLLLMLSLMARMHNTTAENCLRERVEWKEKKSGIR